MSPRPTYPFVGPDGFVTKEWLDEQELGAKRDGGVHNALVREVRHHRAASQPTGPRLISPAKPKVGTCYECGAKFEYMPEDVKTSSGFGDYDSSYVKCPRPKCKGSCSVR